QELREVLVGHPDEEGAVVAALEEAELDHDVAVERTPGVYHDAGQLAVVEQDVPDLAEHPPVAAEHDVLVRPDLDVAHRLVRGLGPRGWLGGPEQDAEVLLDGAGGAERAPAVAEIGWEPAGLGRGDRE